MYNSFCNISNTLSMTRIISLGSYLLFSCVNVNEEIPVPSSQSIAEGFLAGCTGVPEAS